MVWISQWSGWLPLYLIWNSITFLLMGYDKQRACSGKWRVRERTFFVTAFLFGAAGSLAGMYYFRHKTRHLKFIAGMPLMLGLNLLTAYLLWMH